MHIPLEGAPADVDITALRKAILDTDGVKLHVWTLIGPEVDRLALLNGLSLMLRDKFGLNHTTWASPRAGQHRR